MPSPVAANDLSPISGSVQTSRISYAIEPAGKNYGQNYNSTTWYSDIPNDSTRYTIVSDNYTANYYVSRSQAGGGYVEGGLPAVDEYSAPVFWQTVGTSSLDIITIVNGLPDRIGQTPFNSGSQALNWVASSSNYFAVGPDYYRDIDADNLTLYLDANQVISYPTTQSTWYDVSGYNLKASLVNGLESSWSSSGWFNFDGTDDYGTIPSDSSMNSNVFSVEALVRLGVADNSIRTIASRGGNPGAATNGWWMGTIRNGLGGGQNEFRFMWWGTSTYLDRVTSIGAADLRWHHMVATSNGTTGTVYIDGVSNTSAALPAGNLYTDGDAYLIGIADTLGNPWSGSIAQERFYPKALSATEVAQNYYGGPIVTNGLVFAIDAGNLVSYPKSGTTVYDLTGNTNASLINGTGFSTKFGGTWTFDGTDDFIRVSGVEDFANQNAVTIECWARSTFPEWNAPGTLVSRRNQFIMHPTEDANTISYYIYNGTYRNIIITVDDITQWHHYAYTFDGSTLKGYLDGKFITQLTGLSPISNDTGDIEIGSDDTYTNRYLDGDIASVRLYNRALTAEEILQNYNATN